MSRGDSHCATAAQGDGDRSPWDEPGLFHPIATTVPGFPICKHWPFVYSVVFARAGIPGGIQEESLPQEIRDTISHRKDVSRSGPTLSGLSHT